MFKARAPEPSEELESEPKVSDEVQDSPIPPQGDPAHNFVEGESSHAPSTAPPVAASPRCQCPHVRLVVTDDGLGGDIDNPPKA